MVKLKKKHRFNSGKIEINIVDWDDGTPIGYVWFGTKKSLDASPTYDFSLNAKQAVKLAKHILLAAKKAGVKP